MKTQNRIKIDFSLATIGIVTWIVFAILQWGTGTIDWLHTAPFWFWFPLWIGFAVDFAWFIVVFILALIISML